jgi:hypothetical protein
MNHEKVISLGHVGCAGKPGQRPTTFSQLKCPSACLNLFLLSIVSLFFEVQLIFFDAFQKISAFEY